MTRTCRAVLFVSHDVSAVARLCARAIVMNEGQLVCQGPVDDAIGRYLSSRPLGGGRTAQEEREGTGEVRITRVELSAAGDGRGIRADQPFAIRVSLEAPKPFHGHGLRLQLGIHATLGGQYVALSTDYDPERPLDRLELADGMTVSCEVEELPLKPGSYYLSASLERPGGELVDRVTKQAPFAVLPTDYFATGVIPGETHVGPVLVRHRWDVLAGEPADVAAVSGERTGRAAGPLR